MKPMLGRMLRTFPPLAALALAAAAQQSLLVTVLPKKGPVPVPVAEVTVQEHGARAAVTGWEALRDASAALDLFIVIDDTGANLQFNAADVRQFIAAQPATTAVGIAYLGDGTTAVALPPTADHTAAAAAARAPRNQPGATSNRSQALAALITGWPVQPGRRREILLLSAGEGAAPDAAIEAAQKQGVVVFTVYLPPAEANADAPPRGLTTLAEATGGAAFAPAMAQGASAMNDLSSSQPTAMRTSNTGMGSGADMAPVQNGMGSTNYDPATMPVRAPPKTDAPAADDDAATLLLRPLLMQVSSCLLNQYRLTFTPASEPSPQGEPVKVTVANNNVKVSAAAMAFPK